MYNFDIVRICIFIQLIFLPTFPDFELQVTILECLFRLTTASERKNLACKWFRNKTAILTTFNGIREGLFEVVHT